MRLQERSWMGRRLLYAAAAFRIERIGLGTVISLSLIVLTLPPRLMRRAIATGIGLEVLFCKFDTFEPFAQRRRFTVHYKDKHVVPHGLVRFLRNCSLSRSLPLCPA